MIFVNPYAYGGGGGGGLALPQGKTTPFSSAVLRRPVAYGHYDDMLSSPIPSTSDPFWSSVVQMAHFDGINGSSTYTNSTTRGNTLANNSLSALSTTQAKFGTASLRLTSGGSILASSVADYNMGSGDFTVEWWQRCDTLAGATSQVFYDQRPSSTNGLYPSIYTAGSGDIRYFTNNADRITSATGVLVVNTWQHIALAKVSGTTRLFVDGTQVGSSYVDGNTYLQSRILMGISSFATGAQTGTYIDDLRITLGVGRYTANFTAPTAPFPNT